jgi:hypothetical protein
LQEPLPELGVEHHDVLIGADENVAHGTEAGDIYLRDQEKRIEDKARLDVDEDSGHGQPLGVYVDTHRADQQPGDYGESVNAFEQDNPRRHQHQHGEYCAFYGHICTAFVSIISELTGRYLYYSKKRR